MSRSVRGSEFGAFPSWKERKKAGKVLVRWLESEPPPFQIPLGSQVNKKKSDMFIARVGLLCSCLWPQTLESLEHPLREEPAEPHDFRSLFVGNLRTNQLRFSHPRPLPASFFLVEGVLKLPRLRAFERVVMLCRCVRFCKCRVSRKGLEGK